MTNNADRGYVKFSNYAPDHPLVVGLSNKGFRAFVTAICALGRGEQVPPRGRGKAEVVAVGLLVVTPRGLALGDIEDIVLGFGMDPRRDQRRAIPNAVRLHVYERDGWRCIECGRLDGLSLDHVYPWSLGGPDTADNLQTLCIPCNSRKGARV